MINYKVEEVNAGLYTCTLRGPAVERKIRQMARQGWTFEQYEPVIGRCCCLFPRYKMIIVFSAKIEDSQEDNGMIVSSAEI